MLVATVLLVATGCSEPSSSSDSPQLEPPTIARTPHITADDKLPFEAYELSDSESEKLLNAYVELLSDCAADYGVSLTPLTESPEGNAPEFMMWDGRFGTLPLEHARQYGYHASPDGPRTRPFGLFVERYDPPASIIIDGPENPDSKNLPVNESGDPVPSGGCVKLVQDEIGGDPEAIVTPETEEMRLAALHDERTVAAISEWSSCMRAAGYDYSEIDGPADEMNGSALSKKEIAVATQDVQCTEKSRWRDISFAIEGAYQRKAIEANPERYADQLATQQAMLRKAIELTL